MYMIKRKIFPVICLTALLTGCYPTGSKTPGSELNSLSENSDNIDSSNTGQTDIILNVSQATQNTLRDVPKLSVEICKIDANIADVFLRDKTTATKREYPADNFSGEMRYVFDTEDELRLVVEPGRISFNNKEAVGKYNYGYLAALLESVYYGDLDGELDLFSRAQAIERVKRLFQDINLNYIGEPQIYAVTAETANKILNDETVASGDCAAWAKENEVYIMKYPLEYKGIPIVSGAVPILGTDYSFSGSYITAIVTKDEIVSFELIGGLSEKYEAKDKASVNFDADAAFQVLREELSHTIGAGSITIYECRMIYLPVEKQNNVYTFAPFWEFDCMDKGELADYKFSEYINAQTGIRLRDYR